MAKNSLSPYLSPAFFEKFDELTDVPLHLISAEFCPMLDDTITLAKLWKGPLKGKFLELRLFQKKDVSTNKTFF